MNSSFTPKAQDVLNQAKICAEKMGHTYIGTEHLLMGIICTECVGAKILDDKKIFYSDVYDKVVSIAGEGIQASLPASSITPKCKKIIEGSLGSAKRFGTRFIGTEHILYALCDDPECVAARILVLLGASLQSIKTDISSFCDTSFEYKKEAKGISGAPSLSNHSKNLNLLAKEGKLDPVIGRDEEISRIIRVLSRRSKNNPCLIGDSGVGKTAIVEGLAQRIFDGCVPDELSEKIIVSLDLCSMISGTKYRGEFEERMKAVLNEVKSNENIILFIDELHTIIGAGGAEGAIDASNIIKPALARAEIRLIGATTTDEYRRYIEKDSALERRFQPINVSEPQENEAITILKGLKEKYEQHHCVKITDEAITAAVRLSKRYINDRFLPDKAIDLIDEACAQKRLGAFNKSPQAKNLENHLIKLTKEKEDAILNGDFDLALQIRDSEAMTKMELKKLRQRNKCPQKYSLQITENDIAEALTSFTKIPIKRLAAKEKEHLKNLDKELEERVIGQKNAIRTVANSIKRGRTGLKNPHRPIGSFMFLGPTGVGKTHLAKQIANVVFGSEDSIIRFDMSEYSEKHSISKLIGAPPGYAGYEDGGLLTEAVRKRPYSVILFDEVEKAHSDLYNILLQILDDGILSDSKGKHVDFKNSIIILTSNIGAKSITAPKRLGFLDESVSNENEIIKSQIKDALRSEFSPEFLNRLDEIIIFEKLSQNDIEKICSLMLDEIKSLSKNVGIDLEIDESVIEYLSKKGFDSSFGARPLRRAILTSISDPLSDKLLDESIIPNDTVRIFSDGQKILFDK
ncbi:MAG: ATP-dependent Clp protease ATP-binding subunit [Clostridia bacterium]|nr:ATP-dependent Clp protease ATP-binding subunit [Clostridia bacterium]